MRTSILAVFLLVSLVGMAVVGSGCGDRPSDYVNPGDDGGTDGDGGDGGNGGDNGDGGNGGDGGTGATSTVQLEDANGEQTMGSVARNDTADEYLVAWSDRMEVFAAIVSVSGETISVEHSAFDVTQDPPNGQSQPSVAWDSSRNQYIVVYTSSQTGNLDIFTRFIGENGNLIGTAAVNLTGSSTATEQSPHVTYAAAEDLYCVVFEQSLGTGTDVLAILVNPATGAADSSAVLVSGEPTSELNPRVAYNPTDREFLVVWQDARSGDEDIYGLRLDGASASPQGAPFVVYEDVDSGDPQTLPDLAYAASVQEFLVVFESSFGVSRDVLARRVPGGTSDTTGDAFVIDDDVANQQLPVVAYSSGPDRFLVLYSAFVQETQDVLGRTVDAGTETASSAFTVVGGTGSQDHPAVAVSGTTYVVGYDDNAGGIDRNPYAGTGSF